MGFNPGNELCRRGHVLGENVRCFGDSRRLNGGNINGNFVGIPWEFGWEALAPAVGDYVGPIAGKSLSNDVGGAMEARGWVTCIEGGMLEGWAEVPAKSVDSARARYIAKDVVGPWYIARNVPGVGHCETANGRRCDGRGAERSALHGAC